MIALLHKKKKCKKIFLIHVSARRNSRAAVMKIDRQKRESGWQSRCEATEEFRERNGTFSLSPITTGL